MNYTRITYVTTYYGGEGRIRTYVRVHEQIYSLPPLTTRPPLRPENNRGLILYHLKDGYGICPFLSIGILVKWENFSSIPPTLAHKQDETFICRRFPRKCGILHLKYKLARIFYKPLKTNTFTMDSALVFCRNTFKTNPLAYQVLLGDYSQRALNITHDCTMLGVRNQNDSILRYTYGFRILL